MLLINENLERGDLNGLVDGLFFIDRHVSKLGTDAEVATLTFKVRSKEAAQDLANYIEKAYDWVLDADAAPGEDQFQKYSVFVEINRTPKLASHIEKLLVEIENLTDKQEWQFKYKKDTKTHEMTRRNILDLVPKTKNEYLSMIKAAAHTEAQSEIKDFFAESNMHSLSINESGEVKLSKKVSDWSPEQRIGFKLVGSTEFIPSNIFPSKLSRAVQGLLGENFIVEDQGDKFIIHNGKTALEVKDLYAEKI